MSDPVDPVAGRRRERLREELVDEQVPVPLGGAGGDALLDELAFALRPPVHEGRPPRYGAVVGFTPDARPTPTAVPIGGEGLDLASLRRGADGRASFLLRGVGGRASLVGLEHTVEYEADLVRFRPAGTVLVQRTAQDLVRVCTEDGIITWDSMAWRFKPSAVRLAAHIRSLLADLPHEVLGALLDLGVHWLSAGQVGATVVWSPAGAGLPGLDRDAATVGPALELTVRAHRSAWLSTLGQIDRAVVVDRQGSLVAIGVTLGAGPAAQATVPPLGGTRHTSARRFSFDHPETVVMVVSEDGPVSVFSGGSEVGAAAADTCRPGLDLLRDEPDPGAVRDASCPHCGRDLRVAVADFPAWSEGPDDVVCPVCEGSFPVDAYRARALAAARPVP